MTKRIVSKKETLYGISIFSFLFGIFAGTIFANYVGTIQNNELLEYMNTFFLNFNSNVISYPNLLKQSLFSHGKTFGMIWILGLGMFGIPFIVFSLFLKGFSYGFTSAFLLIHYGRYGFLFSFLSFLPQSLVLVPGIILISAASMNFALTNHKNNKNFVKGKKEKWMEYGLVFLIGLLIVITVSIVETFVSPLLINIIINNMTG